MRRFKRYTLQEFEAFIKTVPVRRTIEHIQIHHTWRPRKADYRGEPTIYGMWRHHTRVNGWQDIGQHFSIAPDGGIWDGRSLDINPAGIRGYNSGGLMIEIIGDFNTGQENLQNSQLFSVARVVVLCQNRFGLKNADVVFHREIDTSKTCPGTGLERFWFLNIVDRERKEMAPKDEQMPLIQRRVEGYHNGTPVGHTAYLINGATYVPLRYFAENMGAQVRWDGERYHVDEAQIW